MCDLFILFAIDDMKLEKQLRKAIQKNLRLAERFLALLRCGLPQRHCFFYQNVQPTSGSGFLEIP